ncbi:hypothetical protein [Haliangium sp.]|uniref:hypothetical protein n=1 Tax=Haliangium sp. TaxID=2663208 RepID=UPI003D096C68
MGQVITTDVLMGGFQMSHQEWIDMEEPLRLALLQVFVETSSPQAAGDAYDSYEIVIDLPS